MITMINNIVRKAWYFYSFIFNRYVRSEEVEVEVVFLEKYKEYTSGR